MTVRATAICLLFPALLLGAVAAEAAPRGDAGNHALRKAQYLLQKLSTEKTALEQENQRLAGELEKAQGELASTRRKLDQTAQAHSQAQQRSAALTDRVRADSARISELQETYRREMGDARADIGLLRSAVEERNAWITECQAKNEDLYEANSELLTAYRDKSAWDALKQSDPLTGIASVKLEHTVQEYQFRLEDLRTVEFKPGPVAPD